MVLQWLKRRGQSKRAIEYLRQFPNDGPAVEAILMSVTLFDVKSARDAASILAKREMTDAEWAEVGARWERAWYAIIR